MYESGGGFVGLGNSCRKRFHQRNGKISRLGRGAGQFSMRIKFRVALSRHRSSRFFWRYAGFFERAGKGGFEIQHALDPSLIREGFAHTFSGEKGSGGFIGFAGPPAGAVAFHGKWLMSKRKALRNSFSNSASLRGSARLLLLPDRPDRSRRWYRRRLQHLNSQSKCVPTAAAR